MADITFPHQLHTRIVRAQAAHAVLRGIDATAAYAVPGVVAILTADDVTDLPPITTRLTTAVSLEPCLQPVLANGTVRFFGEPVAAVFATTAGAADDAAELVTPDLSPLEPQLLGSPSGAGGAGTTSAVDAATIRKEFGDLDAAFRAAERIVEVELSWGRDGAMPIETRGLVARWDASRGTLEVWGAARAAHWNCDTLAAMLGLPRAAVLWHAPDVGGGFGVRGELGPEDVLVAHASRLLERPVRWIEDRREHMIAANQARGLHASARAALGANGRLLAIDVDYAVDQGAYVRTEGSMVADLIAAMLPGRYRMDAFRAVGHVRLTNRTPAGSFRGAGRAEAAFIRERLVDAVAAQTALDPVDLRRRNLLEPAAMPCDRQMHALRGRIVHDAARDGDLLDATVRRLSLDVIRHRVEHRRSQGELIGIGTAFVVDVAAPAGFEHVRISVDRRGRLEVVTAAAEEGQGVTTLLAQIVADVVGVDIDAIRVTTGDTVRIPFSQGTFLSRSSVMAGTAAQHTAEALRDKILSAAQSLLGVAADRLTIQSGRVRPADRHVRSTIDLCDLVAGSRFAGGNGFGLEAEGWVKTEAMTSPCGVHVAMAEVDRDTGLVRGPRVFVDIDVGTAINPAMVEVQIVGAVTQGLASTLWTGFTLDRHADPLVGSLSDYGMTTAGEAPAVEVLILDDAPCPSNPLGMKGAGEGGITGIAPAVAAAVDDALGVPGFVKALPISRAAILRHLRTSPVSPVQTTVAV